MTPVGTTIFQGLRANDLDAGVNGLVEYSIVRGDGKRLGTDAGVGRDRVNVADGAEFFAINLPHQGQVTVNRSLDYERTQRYLVTVVATVSTILLIKNTLQLDKCDLIKTIVLYVQNRENKVPYLCINLHLKSQQMLQLLALWSDNII